tara:strand:- start:224 stop:1309 length:1086 start_codon:yes stop_codon:yes gene_type:complete
MRGSLKKPIYHLPSMEDIKKIEPNGYKVISTFSGCGGSSLGYKLAGYKVIWANEFIPKAAEVYKLNHNGTPINSNDIRDIKPEDILKATGLQKGELDLLDGSPPCATFSMSGKREKHWNKVKKYSDTKQRTDDLFLEYIRILRGLKPKVFIGENVSGLIKGASKGYFKDFLKKFKQSGYRVKCYVVNAKYLGVPQNRERVFFIGVRKDLKGDPTIPKPLPYTYTLRDAIWDLRKRKPEIDTWLDCKPDGTPFYYATAYQWDKLSEGQQSDKFFNLIKCHWDKPCNTITAVSGKKAASVTHPTERRKFSIAELKRICAFPDDFKLTGKFEQQWERLGRAVPPPVSYFISKKLQRDILDENTK